ncbi:MAG TPA: PTS fructose transporter subunit IIA [Burkholderiaceae bacterium]|nr:PTS fructose transporter subunit IIA [Burkholderiaceae bacterium]
MVGILVIAHAPLASALSKCAEHVYACEPNARRELRALDVDGNADLGNTVARARELVREVNRGDGVLILTDAFGATPGNVAAQLAESERVVVLAGVNLPMLLRAVCYRGGRLEEVAEKALVGGQQGMLQVIGAR